MLPASGRQPRERAFKQFKSPVLNVLKGKNVFKMKAVPPDLPTADKGRTS